MNAYLLMNEQTTTNGGIVTEAVGLWADQQRALQELADLARDFDATYEEGSASLFIPVDNPHLESDEYYIIEMEIQH